MDNFAVDTALPFNDMLVEHLGEAVPCGSNLGQIMRYLKGGF
jgi:hypothetical protein